MLFGLATLSGFFAPRVCIGHPAQAKAAERKMEGAHSLSLLTWLVLLVPMPLVLIFAATGYLLRRRNRQRQRE